MKETGIKALIESVIADLANNEPINHYALKLQMISRYLKNETFSQWLTKEIDGYENEDTVPIYRILTTHVKANFIIDRGFNQVQISNHNMPLYSLGEKISKEISTIAIKDSIIVLTKLLEGDGPLAFTTTDYERIKLGQVYENCTILSAHKPIQKSDFELILHKFKSSLLDIFMEFNETIFKDEIDFDIMTKEKYIDKIVQQTINTGVYISENASANINNSMVVAGTGNKVQLNATTKSEFEVVLNKIEQLCQDIEADREDIASEILVLRDELSNTIQSPKIIKSALNALKGITIGVAGNKITDLIDNGLEIIRNL